MFDRIVQMSLLFDFYGQLLTEKQQKVLQLYYGNDWSLGEISEQEGVSRQAVYDHVKRAEKILFEYEMKLGLVQKFISTQNQIREILKILEKLERKFLESYPKDESILEEFENIKKITRELLEI
ncbi:MAG TPA: putative DNA-binding protein [Clostridiales bacterium]|nr:putative DNA-binding protein [Clostridiales bacterium]